MQRKLNKFLETEFKRIENAKFIEGITFEQLKRLSVEKNYYHIN